MRAFVALEIPQNTKEQIAALTSPLKNLGRINWVKKEYLHLTAKFIPQLKPSDIEPLRIKLSNIANLFAAPWATAESVQPLITHKQIRLLYLKLKDSPYIGELIAKIEKACLFAGVLEEKRKPLLHVTLGRIKQLKDKNKLYQALNNLKFAPFSWQIENIVLFKSTLTPQGPLYEEIFKLKLSGKEKG